MPHKMINRRDPLKITVNLTESLVDFSYLDFALVLPTTYDDDYDDDDWCFTAAFVHMVG